MVLLIFLTLNLNYDDTQTNPLWPRGTISPTFTKADSSKQYKKLPVLVLQIKKQNLMATYLSPKAVWQVPYTKNDIHNF